MSKKAFTLIELIFVIVIIGILSAVAIPKFRNLTTNSKKSAEKAIVSSIKTVIEDTHSEWSINEGHFNWGNSKYNLTEENLTNNGYPKTLGSSCSATPSSKTFDYILKDSPNDWNCSQNGNEYTYQNTQTKHTWKYNNSTGNFSQIN